MTLKDLPTDTTEDAGIKKLLRRLNIGLLYENQAHYLRLGLAREMLARDRAEAMTGTASDGSPRFLVRGCDLWWLSIPVDKHQDWSTTDAIQVP